VIFLDMEDVLHVAARTLGEVQLRDVGLLEAPVAAVAAGGMDDIATIAERLRVVQGE